MKWQDSISVAERQQDSEIKLEAKFDDLVNSFKQQRLFYEYLYIFIYLIVDYSLTLRFECIFLIKDLITYVNAWLFMLMSIWVMSVSCY